MAGTASGPAIKIAYGSSLNLEPLASYELQSKLLKGGYIGDYIGNYYRGY